MMTGKYTVEVKVTLNKGESFESAEIEKDDLCTHVYNDLSAVNDSAAEQQALDRFHDIDVPIGVLEAVDISTTVYKHCPCCGDKHIATGHCPKPECVEHDAEELGV